MSTKKFKCGGGKYRYSNLLQYSEEKELNGIKIKTINPEGLWYTKQTGRRGCQNEVLFRNKNRMIALIFGLMYYRTNL